MRYAVLAAFAAISIFPGCYSTPPDEGPDVEVEQDSGTRDGSHGAEADKDGGTAGGCASDFNCPTSDLPWCNTTTGQCVECYLDGQCPAGTCDTRTYTCAGSGSDGGGPRDYGHPADTGHPKDGGVRDAGPRDAGTDPCLGVTCSGHGSCVDQGGTATCSCAQGYVPSGLDCVENNACGGCSGHGQCMTWGTVNVCACAAGYTPSDGTGHDCVPTTDVCKGGAFPYDWNNDGTQEPTFEPSAIECRMFELVNYTRATHDPEGTDECHTPLMYSVEWSEHARNHSKQLSDQGGLFHADYPYSQNCAYGCDPACEMDMYMTGANEGHCPPLSHHCNIMRCGVSNIGIGYWDPDTGTWNTQNIF